MDLGREEVERALEWFEIIVGLSKFDSSKPCTVEGLLMYVLLKAANQGKRWVLPGPGSMCPIGSCSKFSPNLFFFQSGVGEVEELPLGY